MGIFLGDTAPAKIFVGGSEVGSVWAGDTKIRPTITPGIFHNSTLGLISISSDTTNRITIADKNLNATNVYNSGNTLSEANCGKFYQYGNNYGFPRTGSITTSSSQVNASNYGPNNYYSSSTYITKNPRDSSGNANLWGNTTNTLVARKGPCATGYHIPLLSERQSLYDMGTSMGAWSSSILTTFSSLLKLPFASFRGESGARSSNRLIYWASTITKAGIQYPDMWQQSNTSVEPKAYYQRQIYGLPIRPFKNEPVVPDSSRTVLYQPS